MSRYFTLIAVMVILAFAAGCVMPIHSTASVSQDSQRQTDVDEWSNAADPEFVPSYLPNVDERAEPIGSVLKRKLVDEPAIYCMAFFSVISGHGWCIL
jgi:hypothetical protein